MHVTRLHNARDAKKEKLIHYLTAWKYKWLGLFWNHSGGVRNFTTATESQANRIGSITRAYCVVKHVMGERGIFASGNKSVRVTEPGNICYMVLI